MAKIKFFTRSISKDRNALVPIYVRVKVGSKIDITCKADILVKADNWSNDTQQSRQRADSHKFKFASAEAVGRDTLNEKIAGLRRVIESEITSIHPSDLTAMIKVKDPENRKAKNESLTQWLETIIDKHWHPEKYRTNLFTFIQSFIDQSETKPNPKTGRPVCYKMRREYKVSFQYLKDFADEKKKEIDFKDIDLTFYNDYTQFLQKKNLAVNTIGKKIQTLKIFLNAAKEENKNPYDGYRSKKFVAMTEESDTIYLSEAELQSIYDLDLSKDEVSERIRDLFIVGCWTGCRFSDISQITPESIMGGMINMRQHKTGKKVIIPLHPVVTAILNKYNGALPKPVTNQEFNRALKVIAENAKINSPVFKRITKGGKVEANTYKKFKLVTTHTARRSFATNLYKNGFPTISIMAITGHTTEKSFLKYIKVTPDEHALKLQEHWENKHLKIVS
jgi:integrase